MFSFSFSLPPSLLSHSLPLPLIEIGSYYVNQVGFELSILPPQTFKELDSGVSIATSSSK